MTMTLRPSPNVSARWLIALFFLASGTAKVFAFQPSAAIMKTVGFPPQQIPIFLAGIILLEIVGGLALLFGIGTRQVSAVLILFLVFATVVFHARFIGDPVAGADQFVHMIENIAIIGGLLVFVADGNRARVAPAPTVS